MNDFEAWQKIIEEWKYVDQIKKMNQRLYDELGGSLMYILEYADRNNIVLPNRERLYRMVDNIHATMDTIYDHHRKIDSSSPKSEHPDKTPEDGTEPIFLLNN